MSRLVSRMHSASREIGTQTSVARASAPGRSSRAAQNASCRAAHSRLRSSASVAQRKSEPPNSTASSPTAAACSATPAAEPWNSKNSVGASGKSSLECRMQARICTSSSSSMRATGMPDWMVAITVSTAPARSRNGQTAADTASGMPCSRSCSSVMMPSVPSEPTKSRVRS